jgi:Permuted papain-like amidase enzyme, YaeF/YiiX, C92 family
MNSIIEQYDLRPGDEIIVPKSPLNMIQHHAIYIGRDQGSADWIVENKLGEGVRTTTAAEFFDGVNQINQINRFQGSDYERALLIERALNSVGKAYNLIQFNCEHLTSELRTGLSVSKQVGIFALGIVGLLVIGALLAD